MWHIKKVSMVDQNGLSSTYNWRKNEKSKQTLSNLLNPVVAY